MKNQTQPTQEFKIVKQHLGFPSKNKTYFTGTEEECKFQLKCDLSMSKRNGADVVEENEYSYTCENYTRNNETVCFEIFEC